jgi:hypothetical protein
MAVPETEPLRMEEYINIDILDNIFYEGKIEKLWEEDKYEHFSLITYLNLSVIGKEEKIKWLISKIQFSWSEKYIRKNQQFIDFIKKIKERKIYKYDNIRKFCFENIEISFHSKRDVINIWRCDTNPFSENYYEINDQLISSLEMMCDWLLRNAKLYEVFLSRKSEK